MEKLDFRLMDTHLRLQSEQKELINYIRHFFRLPIEEIQKGDPNIYVNFTLNDTFQISKSYRRISRNIWLGESSLFISEIERLPGLKLGVKIENDRLYIDAFFKDKNQKFMKKIISHPLFDKRNREIQFIVLTYYLIYYPLFYYLERSRNLLILHASAIEHENKGVILAGLGGVGKSTFCLGSLVLKECKFISDNLIFYDSQNIYACPEPISLDATSIDILKQVKHLLIPQNTSFTHNRMRYQIKPESISCKAVPKYLFWLQWGNENKILPLDKGTCIKHLLNINLLAKELREYYLLAAAFDLAFSQSFSTNLYRDTLSLLLSGVDCFTLQFKPGEDLETVFNQTISRILI